MQHRLSQLVFFVMVLLSGTIVQAQDYSLKIEDGKHPSYFSAAIQGSKFTIEDGKIEGSGVQVAYNYFFQDKWSMHVDISSALGLTGSLQNSYTGINLSVDYGLIGECCQKNRNIYLNDQIIATESLGEVSYLSIGAGLDQYFLNGTKNVYSASGLAVNSKYLFSLFKLTWIVEGKFSMLVSGGHNVSSQSILLGLVFPL